MELSMMKCNVVCDGYDCLIYSGLNSIVFLKTIFSNTFHVKIFLIFSTQFYKSFFTDQLPINQHWVRWCQLLLGPMLTKCYGTYLHPIVDSRLVPSQWETLLQSNSVSHWLGTNLESALHPWAQWVNLSIACIYRWAASLGKSFLDNSPSNQVMQLYQWKSSVSLLP